MPANDRIAHPAGAVGVIVRCPVDRTRAYRAKFSDGVEAPIRHDQLVRLAELLAMREAFLSKLVAGYARRIRRGIICIRRLPAEEIVSVYHFESTGLVFDNIRKLVTRLPVNVTRVFGEIDALALAGFARKGFFARMFWRVLSVHNIEASLIKQRSREI